MGSVKICKLLNAYFRIPIFFQVFSRRHPSLKQPNKTTFRTFFSVCIKQLCNGLNGSNPTISAQRSNQPSDTVESSGKFVFGQMVFASQDVYLFESNRHAGAILCTFATGKSKSAHPSTNLGRQLQDFYVFVHFSLDACL